MTEYLRKIDGFGFSLEEFPLGGGKGYRIKATVLKTTAYYYCSYTDKHDAMLVLERLIDRFDMQTYRNNFAPDYP